MDARRWIRLVRHAECYEEGASRVERGRLVELIGEVWSRTAFGEEKGLELLLTKKRGYDNR